jgi:hypothetical protein
LDRFGAKGRMSWGRSVIFGWEKELSVHTFVGGLPGEDRCGATEGASSLGC